MTSSSASFTALSMMQLPRARAMMVSGAGATGACRVTLDAAGPEGNCNVNAKGINLPDAVVALLFTSPPSFKDEMLRWGEL